MATIWDFFDALKFDWMLYPFMAVLVVGIICSIVGVFVLLRQLVFMGEGVAHTAFAGGALGILLGINPFIPILIFATTSSFTIGYINEKTEMNTEISIGVMFSFFMALAIIFIGLTGVFSADVNSLLFGNVLNATIEDFVLVLSFGIIVLALVLGLKKELVFTTFDEEMAKATGVPARKISYLFLILTSLTIVVSMKAIGAILVFAMIITPAAAAYQWSYKIERMMLLSCIIGVSSAFFGIMISYITNLPSGPSIVILSTIVFVISFIGSPKRRGKYEKLEECKVCAKAMEVSETCPFCEDKEDQEIHPGHYHDHA